jgi:hypothetical protein
MPKVWPWASWLCTLGSFARITRQSLVRLERPLGAVSKQRSIRFLFYIHTHSFNQAPERGQSRLGLQKVDPSADAKVWPRASSISTLGSIARASGRARSGWNTPPEAIRKQRSITFLFYIYTHFQSGPREKAEQAGFAKGWPCHQCQRPGPWPVGYVHLAAVPGPLAKIRLAGMPPGTSKYTKNYHISILCKHIFGRAPDRGHWNCKFWPRPQCQRSGPGQLITYTGQYCQGIRQSSVRLECPPAAISRQKNITFIFYEHKYFQLVQRERLCSQTIKPSANAKGLAPGQLDTYTWQ